MSCNKQQSCPTEDHSCKKSSPCKKVPKCNKKVIIVGGDWCPYTVKAKDLFDGLNVPFDFVDTTLFPEVQKEQATKNNWKSIPMIYVDGVF